MLAQVVHLAYLSLNIQIMNTYQSLFKLLAFIITTFLQVYSASAQETLIPPPAEVLQDAEKVLVKLSNSSPIPKQTKLSKLDSSIFFVNSSNDALLTLSIDFGKRKAHCASGNMKWFKDEGVLRSNEPIAPKDFAVTCFPESGTYNVSVYGLKNDASAVITQVVVP